MNEAFDYIVIGSGSSGSVVAARLAEREDVTVLLLEAGGSDWNPMLHIPLGSGKLLRQGLHGWKYETESIEHLGGRKMLWPRGKVLGGSSAINGMLYARGAREDYDGWAALGNDGWSYDEVLPYFLKSENHLDKTSQFHGSTGPLKVTNAPFKNPLYPAFVNACVEAGIPHNEDFNGQQQEGAGPFDFTIANGRRCSTSTAFVKPLRKQKNFKLELRAQVRKLKIHGARAVGVEYDKSGEKKYASARQEIILCGGVVNSPQLLMLSGIGPGEELKQHGIKCQVDLPGVGQNLQDHIDIPVRFACNAPLSMHHHTRFDRAALMMLQAAIFRSGPATCFPTEAGAFIKSAPDVGAPDLQIHFSTSLGGTRLRFPLPSMGEEDPLEQEGFQIRMCVLRPDSRGNVTLANADPMSKPRISPNYLNDERDRTLLKKGIEIARKIGEQPSLAKYISKEITPNDDDLDAYITAEAASVHHGVGTCKMGPSSDASAVVDPHLKVRGLENVRVADASIMPIITGANTHAPSIMIGEKAASLILEEAGR